MANERYKVTYQEWVLTNNQEHPFQKELKEQTEFFKTRGEAEEFFNLFKNDNSIRNFIIMDIASNKVLQTNTYQLKKGQNCPFDVKTKVGSVACWLCSHHREIGDNAIECNHT